MKSVEEIIHIAEKAIASENPLECIGITIGEELSCKAYYISKDNRTGKSSAIPPHIKDFADRICSASQAELFDYSERGEGNYSVGFTARSCSPERVYSLLHDGYDYAALSSEIRELFLTAPVNLVQLGFLLDENTQICESKLYFSLNSTLRAPSARIAHFGNENPRLADFWKRISVEPRLVSTCLNSGYHPFLLGINRTDAETEHKLYFMVSDKVYHSEENALKLYRSTEMGAAAEGISAFMYDSGLYLRGMAFSLCNGRRITRLYFFPERE